MGGKTEIFISSDELEGMFMLLLAAANFSLVGLVGWSTMVISLLWSMPYHPARVWALTELYEINENTWVSSICR